MGNLAESRHLGLVKLALVTSLVAVTMSLAGPANADPNALRANAQTKLAAVTADVDRANIAYLTPDHGVGANFTNVLVYQREYLYGRLNFQGGKYAEALQHLTKADQTIHSQPMFLPTQRPVPPPPFYRR